MDSMGYAECKIPFSASDLAYSTRLELVLLTDPSEPGESAGDHALHIFSILGRRFPLVKPSAHDHFHVADPIGDGALGVGRVGVMGNAEPGASQLQMKVLRCRVLH